MIFSELLSDLDIFIPSEEEGKAVITTPLSLRTACTFLTLYIVPSGDGFTVFDDGAMFEEWGYGSTHADFERYTKNPANKTWGIQIGEEFFYKDYPNDHSVLMAIDHFVRFFARFDEYCALGQED